MATKKINFKKIDKLTLSALSDFANADCQLKVLRADLKSDLAKLESERESILSKREEYLNQFPHNTEDARNLYSTVEVDAKIAARNEKFRKACEPLRASQSNILKAVDTELYYGYLMYMQTGMVGAKIDITISKKSKGVKVEEHITSDKSYMDMVLNFLKSCGLDYSNSKDADLYTKATAKFAQVMIARTSGVVRNNTEIGEFVKAKGMNMYRQIWVSAFVDYLVNDLGVYTLTSNKTHTKWVLEPKTISIEEVAA